MLYVKESLRITLLRTTATTGKVFHVDIMPYGGMTQRIVLIAEIQNEQKRN